MASHKYLVFDGTYLHRPVSIVVLMDGETKEIISGLYGVSESSASSLQSFLVPLKERGLMPRSATTDGNPQVIRTIRMLWPGVILQRCVVHVQRQGIMWCRRPPKRTDAMRLRELFLRVRCIHTAEERDRFIEDFTAWEQHYGTRIKIRPERGRVFSDIKRARSMLCKALPDMFHYLDDPRIPLSTNGVENYFSRLKGDYRCHRGLHPSKRHNYFNWYFHLKPR